MWFFRSLVVAAAFLFYPVASTSAQAVGEAAGHAAPAALYGRVVDADAEAPLSGTTVQLSGLEVPAVTGLDGSFVFDSVSPGGYLVAAYHPVLDPDGAHILAREVTVEAGDSVFVIFRFRNLSARLADGCAGEDTPGGVPVVGVVLAAGRGVALSGVRVVADGTAGASRGETVTDADGFYRMCSMAAGAPYTLSARFGDRRARTLEVRTVDGPTRADLEIDFSTPSRIGGRVVDEHDAPVASATVNVAGTGLTALTDRHGAFAVEGVPAGDHLLQVSHLGFGTHSDSVHAPSGDQVEMIVRVTSRAIAIEGVVVTARASVPRTGFRRRMERGMGGAFLTRDDIERRSPMKLTNMLSESGLTITGGSSGGGAIGGSVVGRRTQCPPMVYLDGFPITHGSRMGGDVFAAINLVSPSSVEGIEIYRGVSQVPAEFSGSTAKCGVIAIWTR